MHALARETFVALLRAYATYTRLTKSIFHVKNLHLGHVASSLGLREAPSSIAPGYARGGKVELPRGGGRGHGMTARSSADPVRKRRRTGVVV